METSHTSIALLAGRLRPGRTVACLWLAALLSLAPHARAQAETTLRIQSASFELSEGVYQLDATLGIDLPPDARRAIEAGLTMHLDYELEVNRVRRYMPDARVAQVVLSYELSYHAVSQRFLLRNLNTGEQDDYGSIETALAALTSIRSLPVLDASLLEDGQLYEARVRGVCDLSAAPDALRWLLFWTDDWSNASEWYTWIVQP